MSGHSIPPSLEQGLAVAAASSSSSVFARPGMHIPTITALAGSLAGASTHSTVGSSVAHSLASSSYFGSVREGDGGSSQASTPQQRQMLQLDTIYSIDIDDSMEVLHTQASLPAAPHVSAGSLRYREPRPPISLDDDSSSSPPGQPCGGNTAHSTTSSPNSGYWERGCDVGLSPGNTGNNVDQDRPRTPQKNRPAGWNPVSLSRAGSTVYQSQPDQCVLLPSSLVQQYGYLPLVLVQLPMYNEAAHCDVVIERACNMAWPKHRVIIQVCGRQAACLDYPSRAPM